MNQRTEKSKLTTFREKLLENNKLLVGSAAVVVITGLSLGGITGNFVGDVISDSRKAPTSISTADTNNNQTSNNSSSNSEKSYTERDYSSDINKLAKTECRDFLAMSLDNRDKLLDKLFDAGFRNHGEYSQDERTNLTLGVTNSCYDDPRTTINSFASRL